MVGTPKSDPPSLTQLGVRVSDNQSDKVAGWLLSKVVLAEVTMEGSLINDVVVTCLLFIPQRLHSPLLSLSLL